MNEEEKTYKKLLDDLKNLPKVDAPKNFETELLRKINSSELEQKTNFWDKLLSRSKLAPVAVAIVSAAIIFFVVDINSEKIEDPLNIAPRLREDLMVVETFEEIPIATLKKSERVREKSKDYEEELIETKEFEIQNKPEPMLGLEDRSDMKSNAIGQSLADELGSGKSDSDNIRAKEAKILEGAIVPSPVATSASEISRDNFDFMQRNLSTNDKKEVQQLKMKVQAEKSAKKEENPNK